MSIKFFTGLPKIGKTSNVKLLTEFDFCVLRFKIAKLLRTTHRKILSIDVMDDGKIVACTAFILPIEFKNIKEIDDDFKHFYPDVVVPDEFTATDGSHRSIKRDESQLVPLALN